MYDCLIIGGGPSGANCALWLKMLGFTPIIVESRDRLGGLQNESPFQNHWIVSTVGKTGQEIALDIERSILQHKISYLLNTAVVKVSRNNLGFVASTEQAQLIQAKTIVVAAGVSPERGDLIEAKGVYFGPGKIITSLQLIGKRIAILGGGDNAFENYLFLKSRGVSCAHIYSRSIRARSEFVQQVPAHDITLGKCQVNENDLTVNANKYDFVLVLYGWRPNAPDLFSFPIKKDQRGYLKTDQFCATDVAGLYAVGEVTQRTHPCCITAMADGVIAAKAIQARLECHPSYETTDKQTPALTA